MPEDRDYGDNPFIYDDPVSPRELIDRQDETDHLVALAAGSHNSRVQAPRRYGKTSLLLKVADDLEKQGWRMVYVDFLLATTAEEVARRLEVAYRKSLTGPLSQTLTRLKRSWHPKVKVAPGGVGGSAEYASTPDVMQRLDDLLDLPLQLQKKSGERTLVIFDEFQDFLRAAGDLEGLLRSKIQHHGDAASYIYSGSEQALLEEAFGNRRRSLYDQARPLYLAPLADQDIADYIEDRFEKTGKFVEGATLDFLLELVRGHPQRSMLVAHHLWEQTQPGQTATVETFDRALTVIDRELNERFEYTWHSLAEKPNLRDVLLALALDQGTLFSKQTLDRYHLSKGRAQSGEDGLTRLGEVQRVNNKPIIIDPLLERWLLRRSGLLLPERGEQG